MNLSQILDLCIDLEYKQPKYPYKDSRKRGIMVEEIEIGKVTIFFAKPSVAAVEIISGSLSLGEVIRIKGSTTDFEQKVESMEIDRQPVTIANVGQSVGIRVNDRVRPHDKIFKLNV